MSSQVFYLFSSHSQTHLPQRTLQFWYTNKSTCKESPSAPKKEHYILSHILFIEGLTRKNVRKQLPTTVTQEVEVILKVVTGNYSKLMLMLRYRCSGGQLLISLFRGVILLYKTVRENFKHFYTGNLLTLAETVKRKCKGCCWQQLVSSKARGMDLFDDLPEPTQTSGECINFILLKLTGQYNLESLTSKTIPQ